MDLGPATHYRGRAEGTEAAGPFSGGSFHRVYKAGMTTNRALAAALLALSLAFSVSDGMAQGCLSSREGRQLMEQGEVVPFPEAVRRAGLSSDQVVEVQLCQSGGGYVYRVRVLESGGEVRARNIPAR
jgi:hypothetical protein